MKFKEYLDNAWALHVTDSKKVADEFKQSFQLMESEDDVMAMTKLIVHVCGEHLGEWNKGIELLRKLKNNATIKDPSAMKRYVAILNLGNNPNSTLTDFSFSDQIIIYASTSSALLRLGGIKNADKFLRLAAEIAHSKLSKDDPADKTLGTVAAGIVSFIEEKRDPREAEIVLLELARELSKRNSV